MMATISDASGQYVATVFDDAPSAALEAAAKSGSCGLMNVELDRRPGDEVPRVTVKHFQPMAGLASKTRLQLHLRLADSAALAAIARRPRCGARRQWPGPRHRAGQRRRARRH